MAFFSMLRYSHSSEIFHQLAPNPKLLNYIKCSYPNLQAHLYAFKLSKAEAIQYLQNVKSDYFRVWYLPKSLVSPTPPTIYLGHYIV